MLYKVNNQLQCRSITFFNSRAHANVATISERRKYFFCSLKGNNPQKSPPFSFYRHFYFNEFMILFLDLKFHIYTPTSLKNIIITLKTLNYNIKFVDQKLRNYIQIANK